MVRPKPSSPARTMVALAFIACTGWGALALPAPAGSADESPRVAAGAAGIAPWFPSGPPGPAFLRQLPRDVHVDNFGNAWTTRGSGAPHVLLLTHRDVPGWVVSQITADGFLRMQRLGTGPTALVDQFAVGKRLVVYTQKGPLPVVATAPSTHFRRGADVPVPEATVDDLWLDVGAESAAEAEALGLALLDPVVMADEADGPVAPTGMPRDDVAGPAAGVRVACALVDEYARAVPARGTLTCAWVAGGTEGARGSHRLLDTLPRPDSVIVLEAASPSTDDSVAATLGYLGPPWVSPGDTTNASCRRWAAAVRLSTPTLTAPLPATPSPDARVWAGAGIPTVVVSFPIAYPGTPHERANVRDVSMRLMPFFGRALPVEPSRADFAATMPAFNGFGPAANATWPEEFAEGAGHADAWGTIRPLLAAYGVSEHETAVAAAVRAALPPDAAPAVVVDERGNVELRMGVGRPGRLFVAHMDEIGYRVTGPAPGFGAQSHVERKGGFYDWLYEGQAVRIGGARTAARLGVVAPRVGYRAVPRPAVVHPLLDEIHGPAPAASRFDVADVRVDGFPLSPMSGDDITVLHAIARLGAHRFAARAIDDRFGDAALVMAARKLWAERGRLPNPVWLVWSVEEETGLKGATWLADSLAHHGALPVRVHAVDTFVSSDSPLEDPRIGGARLGRGAVIRAVDTSHEAPPEAVRATLALARRENIPLQFGVTAGGNDGVPFAEHGAINVPLGWPLRSSHSAVEVADLRDLESLARMVQVLAEQPAVDDPRRP
jgi:putative aminopeptidase FrvX